MRPPQNWLGYGVMGVGLLVMVAGVGVLGLRLAAPETAAEIFLPPTDLPPTPTPAYLSGTPLAPPPRQIGDAPIMPQMAVAPPDDTDAPTRPPPATQPAQIVQLASDTPPPPPSPTETPTASPSPSETRPASRGSSPAPAQTATPIPFITPTPSVTPSPSPTLAYRQPDRLLIPALDLDAPIESVGLQRIQIGDAVYSQWQVPEWRAVGWHASSAGLGQPGNTVLNGHHNQFGHVFRDLIDIQPGDLVRLEAPDGFARDYTIVQSILLEEEGRSTAERLENARWLLPSYDERITLVTCWPPDGRSHRLVVIALPTEHIGTTSETE
ncbi:MAG: sortase domain-bontaining protein [Anaerolineales bacterium]